jgi:hypothetical protein
MSDNIIEFPNADITHGNIDPQMVLTSSLEKELDTVLVLGWTKSGNLHMASSDSSLAENITLLELAKHEHIAMLLE